MKRYQLITKFGVTDGHYDYHQIMESHDIDSLKVIASITQVIPYCENDELLITEKYFSNLLNCYVGKKLCS